MVKYAKEKMRVKEECTGGGGRDNQWEVKVMVVFKEIPKYGK